MSSLSTLSPSVAHWLHPSLLLPPSPFLMGVRMETFRNDPTFLQSKRVLDIAYQQLPKIKKDNPNL